MVVLLAKLLQYFLSILSISSCIADMSCKHVIVHYFHTKSIYDTISSIQISTNAEKQ